MNKTRILEFSGKGLSFRDAISMSSLNSDGNLETIQDYKMYKKGTLRFKKMGRRAIPVIQYDGETDDQICVAFRIEEGNKYIDIDVQLIADALTCYARRKTNSHDGRRSAQ